MRRFRHMLALGVVVAVLAAGCSKEEPAPLPPPEAAPNAITSVEAERGAQACKAYADKVCECSAADDSHAGACELARGKVEALDLALRVTRSKMSPKDMGAALHNARLMMKACIEDTATLTADGCSAIPTLGQP